MQVFRMNDEKKKRREDDRTENATVKYVEVRYANRKRE